MDFALLFLNVELNFYKIFLQVLTFHNTGHTEEARVEQNTRLARLDSSSPHVNSLVHIEIMVGGSLFHYEIEWERHGFLAVQFVNAIVNIIVFSASDGTDCHQSVELFSKLKAFITTMVSVDSFAKP